MNASGSRKRKRPDEDEELTHIEKQYLNKIQDDDDEEEEEEDNDKVVGALKPSEYDEIVKAQEPATLSQHDGIKIIPFNLEEEYEEGKFDEAGNFIFEKEDLKDEEHDTWAESIDWDAVERQEQAKRDRLEAEEKGIEKEEVEEPKRSRNDCYKQMLRLMRPEETVQKTIRRLGNEIPKRKPNRPSNKEGSSSDQSSNSATVTETRRKLNLMIELAHETLEDGDTDIYQKSYDQLEDALN